MRILQLQRKVAADSFGPGDRFFSAAALTNRESTAREEQTPVTVPGLSSPISADSVFVASIVAAGTEAWREIDSLAMRSRASQDAATTWLTDELLQRLFG